MKYIPLFAQISALTMAAISKRPDAMGYAAIFAVLCVVAVVFKRTFSDTTGSTKSRPNGSRNDLEPMALPVGKKPERFHGWANGNGAVLFTTIGDEDGNANALTTRTDGRIAPQAFF